MNVTIMTNATPASANLIHGENVRPGIFADVARRRGGRLEEWSFLAYEHHSYTYGVPDGAVERWARDDGRPAPDLAPLPAWNRLGERLCDAFLDYSIGRFGRLAQSCHEPA